MTNPIHEPGFLATFIGFGLAWGALLYASRDNFKVPLATRHRWLVTAWIVGMAVLTGIWAALP